MTIRERLYLQSNDYSSEEKKFKEKTGINLLDKKTFPQDNSLSVSVIIPAFRAYKTLPLVLEALNRQTFLTAGGILEVVVIDDASVPAMELNTSNYSFNLHLIRSETNKGAGHSRDLGIKEARNDLIVFVDADILVPSDFISNHVFAHTNLASPGILVGFRENVTPDDYRLYNPLWLESSSGEGDHRIHMIFKKEWVMRAEEEAMVGKEFSLLKETNNFKEFGNGKKIELWTLPMMVLTCCFSARREYVIRAFPTPVELSGWGFNDTCLAAKMISDGLQVIPLLNSNVLHILEPVHTKADSIKNKEYLLNEKVYEKLLDEEVA